MTVGIKEKLLSHYLHEDLCAVVVSSDHTIAFLALILLELNSVISLLLDTTKLHSSFSF